MRWIASWAVCFFHLGGAHLFGRMKINTFQEWTAHSFNWVRAYACVGVDVWQTMLR